MTINAFDESRQPVEAQEIGTPDTLDKPVSSELEIKTIADALDIDSDNSNYTDEIDWLLKYAKLQAEDSSVEGLRWVLRDLEIKLGSPPMLEDRVKYLARYAYLFLEGRKMSKEMHKMVRRKRE